ncbi:hypothetical protein OHB26_24695 [Nocardia sp. NBC_01503]|uniref:hypothetical protein n=1 Tax=Nocardia sp. NBC_01503 TaxID=2975997 RepID=UPI002E7BEF96|nr:hypothetical protein [Nocardia sp. NBC_01503]WTL30139.1 hypothetical protein OHB26_24695 [Nocardia sp. NBC_01503]
MNEYFVSDARGRTAVPMSSPMFAALILLAFVFAVGVYLGVLLFGSRSALPSTVVVCPAPGTANVALWPSDCPREAVAP